MNSVVRTVAELSADERHVYESALGQPLQDNQRIFIQLVNAKDSETGLRDACGADALERYAMWADLSDEEIAELESAILD